MFRYVWSIRDCTSLKNWGKNDSMKTRSLSGEIWQCLQADTAFFLAWRCGWILAAFSIPFISLSLFRRVHIMGTEKTRKPNNTDNTIFWEPRKPLGIRRKPVKTQMIRTYCSHYKKWVKHFNIWMIIIDQNHVFSLLEQAQGNSEEVNETIRRILQSTWNHGNLQGFAVHLGNLREFGKIPWKGRKLWRSPVTTVDNLKYLPRGWVLTWIFAFPYRCKLWTSALILQRTTRDTGDLGCR